MGCRAGNAGLAEHSLRSASSCARHLRYRFTRMAGENAAGEIERTCTQDAWRRCDLSGLRESLFQAVGRFGAHLMATRDLCEVACREGIFLIGNSESHHAMYDTGEGGDEITGRLAIEHPPDEDEWARYTLIELREG